jgi:hypothetical protein
MGTKVCEVRGCRELAIKGRILCDPHAYPAEQKKSGRRKAIEAQKKAKSGRELAESKLEKN